MNWKKLIYKESALATNQEDEISRSSNDKQRQGSPRDRKNRAGDNPYLSYRRRWNDHTGSILAQRNLWMIATLALSLITLASIGGLIHIGSQSKFIPYIVEVDKLGKPLAVSPAQQISVVNDNVIHASVASFINDARMVTPDVTLQRQAILRLYAALIPSEPATAKMNEHLNGDPESNPFARAANETVSIQIVNVLRQTPQTWQVDWVETIRDRKGSVLQEPFRMRALVTTNIITPTPDTTEAQIRNNPLGVYVTDFTWSKTL
jgi:type IV secretory pathway TrbF-like protein